MQLIFPTDNRQPEIECKSSSQAAIKGAFSDYQMEATKNAQSINY